MPPCVLLLSVSTSRTQAEHSSTETCNATAQIHQLCPSEARKADTDKEKKRTVIRISNGSVRMANRQKLTADSNNV
jgi:hypothetical protein